MNELRKIDVPINKLLCKYDLKFTKEGRSKISEVYVLTTAFVSFILNEITKGKLFNEDACEKLLKHM